MSAIVADLGAYAAAFLAALLIASAVHKIAARARLSTSAATLARAPDGFGPILLWAAITAELAAGAALIIPATRALGAVAAILVWGLYGLLLLRALAEGRAGLDCGCSFGRGRDTLTAAAPLRNLILAGIAIAVFAVARLAAPASVGVTEVVAGLAALSLYAAIDQIAPLGWPAR